MPGDVFILERLNWRAVADGWRLTPGSDRVEAFATRTDAEAAHRDGEWALRRRINPFRCGGPFLHYQTTFDAARLHDWFLDAGLDSPGISPHSNAWAEVWDRDHAGMTDAQRAAAWEALDRVRFYRVVEGQTGRPMYLVALRHNEEDPIERPYGRYRHVGSTPYMLVRNPRTADELCNTLYIDRVVRTGGYVGSSYVTGPWDPPDVDPFEVDPHDEQRIEFISYGVDFNDFAERRPLDLCCTREPTPGQSVYVVLRRAWRLEVPDDGVWRWNGTGAKTCGRAVAAFDTLAAADAAVARLEAEARTYPSPFRFGPPHEWGPLDAGRIWGMLSKMAPINFATLWNDYKPPESAWSRWWDENVSTLTADDIATTWALYEWLRFYEVVEVEYRD
jgi:hypothetical protein